MWNLGARIGDNGAALLSYALKDHPSLKTLLLGGKFSSHFQINHILHIPVIRGGRTHQIRYGWIANGIGDEGVKFIADSLKCNSSVQELNLQGKYSSSANLQIGHKNSEKNSLNTIRMDSKLDWEGRNQISRGGTEGESIA